MALFDVNDLNKQSAENLINEVNELKSQLNTYKEQVKDSDYKSQVDEKDKIIESLTKALEESKDTIKEYQTLNQKLFLRVSNEVKESPTTPEPEVDPLVASALDKIDKYNQTIGE